MATGKATPDAVKKIRVTQVICDLQAGPLRCVAQLSAGATLAQPKAVWRNEVGIAAYTPQQVRT